MTQLKNIDTKTIDEFVSQSINNSIEFQNSSYFEVVDSEIISEEYNIFRDRYYGLIINYTESYTMSDSDFIKYKYRPKLLSADLYNSIDYWYILLMVNNMSSILEFTKKNIKVLTTDGIAYIKSICKKEESTIAINKTEVDSILTENIITDNYISIIYGNNIYIAGSSNGKGLYYSSDKISWTQSNITTGYFYNIRYVNNKFIVISATDTYYSSDGKTWKTS